MDCPIPVDIYGSALVPKHLGPDLKGRVPKTLDDDSKTMNILVQIETRNMTKREAILDSVNQFRTRSSMQARKKFVTIPGILESMLCSVPSFSRG